MFYPIYKAFEWVAEGVPKKALESKKKEEPTPIFRSFRGVLAPICCSDWLNQM